MTKVQAIEEEIKRLSPGELAELRDWLLEHTRSIFSAYVLLSVRDAVNAR
jgi:hypothetical protein